jgi:hypothetical protein
MPESVTAVRIASDLMTDVQRDREQDAELVGAAQARAIATVDRRAEA